MTPRLVRLLIVFATALGLLHASAALATTVVPMTDPDLVEHSVAIVIGQVRSMQSHWDPAAHQVFTLVAVGLDEVLKGEIAATEITLKQLGGRVGGLQAWVEGSARFQTGERVLLFLSTNRDGTLRVAHLFQGKFSIVTDPATGDDVLERDDHPAGVKVMPAPGTSTQAAPAGGRRHLRDMKALIQRLGPASSIERGMPPVTEAVAPSSAITQTADAFTYLGSPSRWFEPDAGTPITMLMNSAGEPLAPGLGFDAIRSAYAAWNGVTTSTARYRDGGTTTAVGFQSDGVDAITFEDPLGQMDPPVGCTGTLALGGYFSNTTQTRVVNGTTFERIVEGDVVFADGWQGCGVFESLANISEIATHELGHVLGLGHSTDPQAIMYAYAHLDGRGGRLAADDIAGVTSIYPVPTVSLAVVKSGTGSGTVTSSPAGIACGSTCSGSYPAGTVVTLTAAAASGSTFAGWSGGGCSGTGTCQVTVNAATTVTATFNTTPTTPPPTGGLTAAFSYPAQGAIVGGTQSIGMTTNEWGTAKTLRLSVDGTLLSTATMSGTAYWYRWNTTGVADGTHTLMLVVRTATGSATATLAVKVANGTTPPSPAPSPLTASFTSPAAGATVGGAQTVGMASSGGATGSRTFTLALGATVLSQQTVTGTSASYAWDTRTVANGSYTLTATVRDSAGTSASATRTVTVSNTTTAAPFTASFTYPAAGATVGGTQSVGMSTTATWGTSKTFSLSVDGKVLVRATITGTTLWYYWNTATVANGTHTLTLSVANPSGTAATTRTVTVKN